ncbi:MAG: AAA family ATPase, partial [bacterium]|nr:AAA family ATPase [bacterium]
WLWMGPPGAHEARIEILLDSGANPALRYRIVLGTSGNSFVLGDERLENEFANPGEDKPTCFFGYESGCPVLNVSVEDSSERERRRLRREDIDPTQSILSQRKDPDAYPELTRLSETLGRILIYRGWHFGPDSGLRLSCRPDVRTDRLSEEFDNLPARLAALKRVPAVKKRLLDLLGELAPGFDDLEVIPEGGRLQLYLTENARSVPAHRLSDGTLRYLCLIAILVDPSPASVIVIEEPELGLHPDVLPILRDLMAEASAKCQLVITTHSTQFVDAMTDHADSVLVCEKPEGPTLISRLTQEEVNRWRKHGSLGYLWMAGHIGGTRW